MIEAERLLADFGVPRETGEKLRIYVGELLRWQRVTNLVAPSTLDNVWQRHIADSLQLATLADGMTWSDLGSGGGFPGLVLAIVRPDRTSHLIESDGRKCAFLRHVAHATGTPVYIWNARVEKVLPRIDPKPDVITARALASLSNLLQLSHAILRSGATALFPKGRNVDAELTEAGRSWRFDHDVVPSRSNPQGRILRVRNVVPRNSSTLT